MQKVLSFRAFTISQLQSDQETGPEIRCSKVDFDILSHFSQTNQVIIARSQCKLPKNKYSPCYLRIESRKDLMFNTIPPCSLILPLFPTTVRGTGELQDPVPHGRRPSPFVWPVLVVSQKSDIVDFLEYFRILDRPPRTRDGPIEVDLIFFNQISKLSFRSLSCLRILFPTGK